MRQVVPHALGVVGAVLAIWWAGRINRVATVMTLKTFEPQVGLFLGALALLVLAGFVLAAPVWWPRPRFPRTRISWYLAAIYGIVGLFLATPSLVVALAPWLPATASRILLTAPDRVLPGIQSTSATVRTLGCLLLGYGVGLLLREEVIPSGGSE